MVDDVFGHDGMCRSFRTTQIKAHSFSCSLDHLSYESRNDRMKTGEISDQAIPETPRSKSVLNNEKMNSKILNVETDQDLRKLLHA